MIRRSGIAFLLFSALSCLTFGQSMEAKRLLGEMKGKDGQDKTDLMLDLAHELGASNIDSMDLLGRQALRRSIDVKYANGQIKSLRILGESFWYRSEIDSARYYYSQSIELASAVNNELELSKLYHSMGILSHYYKDFPTALELYFASMELKEKLSDTRGKGISYIQIANLYGDQNDFQNSLKYTELALDIFKEVDDINLVAIALNNIGECYLELDEPDKAIPYLDESLSIKRELNNVRRIANTLNVLGQAYLDKSDLGKSYIYFDEALSLNQQIENVSGIGYSLLGLANIDCARNNRFSCERKLDEALSIAEGTKDVNLILESYDQLSAHYKKNGNYRSVVNYLEKAQTIRDSIFTAENNQFIERLKTQNETSRIERENQELRLETELSRTRLLNNQILLFGSILVILVVGYTAYKVYQKNKQIEGQKQELGSKAKLLEKANNNLELAYRELESFSYSVSHDLKAPLRGINGLSQILMMDYGDQLDDKAKELLSQMRTSTLGMNEVIDDLMMLSKVSSTQLDIQTIDISQIALHIIEEILRENGEHSFRHEIESGLTVEADPGLSRILLQNLLRNAVKFSTRSDQAVIEFSRQKKEGMDMFCVSDNGTGFNMDQVDLLFKPFSRLHSEREYIGSGIGLSIVKRIVERHGGRVDAWGEVGIGAKFYFTLG